MQPDCFVNVAEVMEAKCRLLACHVSQKAWLDASQGMDAYLEEMQSLCAKMGRISESFSFAEAFIHHSHLGFCDATYDPLQEALSAHYRSCKQALPFVPRPRRTLVNWWMAD